MMQTVGGVAYTFAKDEIKFWFQNVLSAPTKLFAIHMIKWRVYFSCLLIFLLYFDDIILWLESA